MSRELTEDEERLVSTFVACVEDTLRASSTVAVRASERYDGKKPCVLFNKLACEISDLMQRSENLRELRGLAVARHLRRVA